MVGNISSFVRYRLWCPNLHALHNLNNVWTVYHGARRSLTTVFSIPGLDGNLSTRLFTHWKFFHFWIFFHHIYTSFINQPPNAAFDRRTSFSSQSPEWKLNSGGKRSFSSLPLQPGIFRASCVFESCSLWTLLKHLWKTYRCFMQMFLSNVQLN